MGPEGRLSALVRGALKDPFPVYGTGYLEPGFAMVLWRQHMVLMTLEGIGITFGDTAILQNVTQGIDEYDRASA